VHGGALEYLLAAQSAALSIRNLRERP